MLSLTKFFTAKRETTLVKRCALTAFRGVRSVAAVATSIPGSLQQAARDVSDAWCESADPRPNGWRRPTMLETGFVVFLAIALILAKLPRRMLLKILGHDLAIDVMVTVVTLVIHWGTFSSVMAATVAGLLTSLAASSAKRLFGYVDGQRLPTATLASTSTPDGDIADLGH